MRNQIILKNFKKEKRHRYIRAKISGNKDRPRLFVFRSNQEIYASLIDDLESKTLLAHSSKKLTEDDFKNLKEKSPLIDSNFIKVGKSFMVGYQLAQQALEQNIKKVVFDRGGYAYAGRIKALAEGARAGGLEF